MCIGTIIEGANGRKGEIISIDFVNKIVVVHGIAGGYWTDSIGCVKVVSYTHVQ